MSALASNGRRTAVIDQGSNTLLLLAVELQGGRFTRLAETIDYPRLGEGVRETGRLSEAAMQRGFAALQRTLATCRKLGVQEFHLLGTSALRLAQNAGAYLELIRRECGLTIRVISEEEEARLSFALAAHHLPPCPGHRAAVVDIGGSSSEVSFSAPGDFRRPAHLHSLPFGAVTFTERHRLTPPLTEAQRRQLSEELAAALTPLPTFAEPLLLLGTSGTYTTLAALARGRPENENDRVESAVLARRELQTWAERLCSLSGGEIAALPGMEPRRADVITAGALIALALTERLGVEQIRICSGGIRWGYLYDCLLTSR